MQINRIKVVVRPRNPWESIDLGFSLIQQWAYSFYRIWLVTVVPFVIIVHLLFYQIPWLAPLIVWWLKPLFDRVILYFLSRALFGEPPGIRQTLRILPTFFNFNLFLALTLWRFDFARSFNLPVLQLEGLPRKIQSQRIRLLQHRTRNTATWLTVICLHFEGLLHLSLFGLLYLMIPADYTVDWIDWSEFLFKQNDAPLMLFLNALFSLIVLTVIEPLYVSGGFTLYLNRRTHLEGWDIELAFRQIALTLNLQTPAKTTILLLLMTMTLYFSSGFMANSLFAATAEQIAPQEIQQTMNTILQQSEFQTHRQVNSWQWKETSADVNENHDDRNDSSITIALIKLIAQVIELILWVVLGIAVFIIIRYALIWSERLRGSHSIPTLFSKKVRTVPQTIHETFSLTQLAERAYSLWQAGETFAALSLLYRGTLVALITYHGVTIAKSATEGECLQTVKKSNPPVEITAYFMMLTRIWQNAAYAQRLPPPEKMQQLCTEWQRYFGQPRS